jgi:hypothetical protein
MVLPQDAGEHLYYIAYTCVREMSHRKLYVAEVERSPFPVLDEEYMQSIL